MQHVSAEHKAIRQVRQKGKNPLCKYHNPCIWLGSQLHKNIIKTHDKPKYVVKKNVKSNTCDKIRSLKIWH